jgi:hypothetical protein
MKICQRRLLTTTLLLFTVSLASAQFPEPFGLWQFDNNTLNNDFSLRSAMAATNFTATYAEESIATHSARALAVPALSAANQNLSLPTSSTTNGGGAANRVNQWSVVMDVKLTSLPAFTALLQTSTSNADTADVNLSSTGALEFSGLNNAISGPLPQVTVGKWTRLAITCGNNGAGGPLTVRGYIDGLMVFENTGEALNGRYSQQGSVLLFADFQGRSSALSCNSVAYWSSTLSETDVDDLGGPSAGGLTRFLVVSEDSSGPGTLTQAITDVTNGTGSIGFSRNLNGRTILLTTQYFLFGATIKVDATALPDGITLDANLTSRHFQISGSATNLSLRNLTLTRGKVTGAERGGSIRSSGKISLSRCTFRGNSSENGGGAIDQSDAATVDDCLFADNSAPNSGGALFLRFGTINITRCTFTQNSSNDGSAVDSLSNAIVTLSNCTLVGNQAANQSMIDVSSGSVTLQNCTITGNRGNSANSGLLVRSSATATVSGCIIAGNLGAGGVTGDIALVGGTLNASGSNFIGSNAGATTQFPTGPLAGTNAAPLDPKLSPLGFFGGPMQTVHPLVGSPVIDAAGTTNPGGTDARGFSRFVDGDANATAQLDIGAVEAGPLFTVTATGDAAAAPGTLRTVLASAVSQPGARIVFNSATFPTGTVTLGGTEITIPSAGSVFIDASNLSGPVTISGNNLSRIFSIPATATLAMHSLRMINGLATVGRQEGGGVLNQGSATIMACTLSGNRAANGGTSNGGGGIFNAGVMMLASSTLSGNQAGHNTNGGASGGGIRNDGSLTIVSSTLSGNSAGNATVDGDDGGDGGGILNDGILTLSSSTVAANAAGQGLGASGFNGMGGGIRNRSKMTLQNSIVAGNTGLDGPDLSNGGNVITASGVNILSNVANSDLTAGATVIVADPLLAPLSSRGGPTPTMALLPGSPARNAAASTLRTDQRGFPLVGTADIGAYEVQIGSVANTTINEDTGTGPLAFTVGQVGTLTGTSSNTTLVPNANIVFGGSGSSRTVTVTPTPNQSGSAVITITDSLSTETQSFTVTVNALDDISPIGNQTIDEDTGTGPLAFTVGQVGTLTGTSSNTTLVPNANIVFGGSGASRTVTVTPVSNRNGSAIITIADSLSGEAQSFTLTVSAVDDTPSFTKGADQSALASSGPQSIAGWATNINDGDPEVTQTLTFIVTNSNNAIFSAQPAVDPATGTLTFTPSEVGGNATVSVSLQDSGSTSAVQTFTISVVPLAIRVTNRDNSGAGSLRQALADSESFVGPNTIVFSAFLGGPILLTSEIVLNDSAGITIDASDIPDGVTIDGGPGTNRLFRVMSSANVTMRRLKMINGNGVGVGGTGPDGGAIFSQGTLTLRECTISNCSAVSGGAIWNDGQALLTIERSTLSGNSAFSGGGAIAHLSVNLLTLSHCTVANNTARFEAGGINVPFLRPVLLNHCTITGNSVTNAGNGTGGVRGDPVGSVTVRNSIITGNTDANIPGIPNIAPGFISQGTNIIGTDAQLAPLGNYAGPTQTRALLPGSPARDAATNSTATTDQRGYPLFGTADIGAYERQLGTIPSATIRQGSTPVPLSFPIGQVGTLIGTSSNEVAVPNGFVTFNGSGTSHTATVNPLPAGFGSTVMTITDFTSGETQNFNFNILSFRVTSSNDSGPGSLRQALANAAAIAGPDTVTFGAGFSGATFSLQSQLIIADNDPVTLDASNLAGGLTLDAEENSRHFHVQSGKTLTLRGLTLTRGSASGNGGSILNEGTLNLDRCALIENDSTGDGGAIHSTGTLDAENSAFAQNQSGGLGGGISVSGGTADLIACTLSGNSSSNGGALSLDGDPEVELSHCTVSGNSSPAQFSTGGIVAISGDLSLEHCTVSQNAGLGSGGGLFIDSLASVEIISCLIAGNTDSGPADDILNSGGTLVARGNSLIGNNQSVATQFPASPLVGTATAPVDARLAPLGNYGGPTQTMMPLPGSPAIDQGSPVNPAFTTDQRGFPRLLGLRPDIGAVEGPVIIVTTPVDELDSPGAPGSGISLREAIRDVEAGGIIAFDRAVFAGATPTMNTITLTRGPLNPQRSCTLNGTLNPGGITIVHLPTITAQPLSQSVASNAAANFAVAVTNLSGGVAYAWRKNATPNGITTASLSFANAQESDEGVYDVLLSEASAPGTLTLSDVVLSPFSATSQPASLVVNGAPITIQRHPANAMIALGSSHTLSVVAVGPAAPVLTYQWTLNGKNISGATRSSHLIARAALTNAGTYRCVVKSGATSVPSDPAEIGVVDTTPKTVNLLASATAGFTPVVSAAGNGLSFVWRRDATVLATTSQIFPQIKPATPADAGLYTCTVTGPAGSITGCNTRLNVSSAVPQLVTPITLPPATIGHSYFYQLPVQSILGAPATSFSVAGTLPTGITLNATTGILSGRPTVTKTGGYALSFKAGNAKGFSPASPLTTLIVNVVPPTAVGVFAGPMPRSPLNDNLGGRFDLTTMANGMCSGSITLGGRAAIRFTSQLLLSAGPGDAILLANIPGITLADRTVLTAYMEVFVLDQRAVLTLVHPTLGTTVLTTVWRNPWLLSTNPALNNPATRFAAYYTLRLNAGVGGTVSPSGYGFASFTISTAGALTLAGKLPDGSGITGGTFVSKDGEILLFNALYANRGSHVGQFVITPGAPVTNNIVSGTTSWNKPGPLTPTSADTVYRDGFGPLNVIVEGSPYVAPARGQRVMGLGTSPNPNAKLDFTLGGLAPEFAQLLYISNPSATGLTNKGTLTLPLTNSAKLTTLDAAKGSFTGSFQINGATTALNRPAPFEGLIVKIGATTQGYGYFLLPTATPKISTSPKLSGRVILGVP